MQPPDKIKEELENVAASKENPAVEHLTEINQLAQFIMKLKLTNELEGCALEYCLVKIGSLAEELLRKKYEESLNKYAETYQIKDLPEILTGLVQVRNCLADNFYRLAPSHHNKFFILQNNPAIVWLANPVLLKAPLNNKAIVDLQDFKKLSTELQKKGRKSLDKLGCITFLLDKMHGFCITDSKLEKEETRCAVSMLMVAAGTCAREILRDNYIKASLSAGIKSCSQMMDWLDHFKRSRDLFAHVYAFAKKGDAWQNKLAATMGEIPNCIKALNVSLQEWEKFTKETCKRPTTLTELAIITAPSLPPPLLLSSAQILQNLSSPPPLTAQEQKKEMRVEEFEEMMKDILGEKSDTKSAQAKQPTLKRTLPEKSKEAAEEKKKDVKKKKVELSSEKQTEERDNPESEKKEENPKPPM